MAHLNGRVCGAKRPRCGASGHLSPDLIWASSFIMKICRIIGDSSLSVFSCQFSIFDFKVHFFIFLVLTIRLIRYRHFDFSCIKQRLNISFRKVSSAGQPHKLLHFFPAARYGAKLNKILYRGLLLILFPWIKFFSRPDCCRCRLGKGNHCRKNICFLFYLSYGGHEGAIASTGSPLLDQFMSKV